MAMRIRRLTDEEPTGTQDLGYIACGPGWDRGDRHDPRLEQDMDAMLEADVEYFDHPTLGRVRLRDHLVLPHAGGDAATIEAEQEADEFP